MQAKKPLTSPRAINDLFGQFARAMRPQRMRTMREFAEQELIIPDGPHKGRRFRCSTQPFSGLWFDAIDSGKWNRFAATGPSQSGKTLCCAVTPVMYHLFEVRETTIFGVPDMEMAYDKWQQDLLPAIEASRYRDLLPKSGRGSRGGTFTSVTFQNGATLRFMSGGGDDKNRAGFTSRVLVITEVDGLGEAGSASLEANPFKQMEARTRAYGNRKRIYVECTVSTDKGIIWQEYQNGTASRILLPCPHCAMWVLPERENFLGWEGRESEFEAENSAQFYCPNCATGWSESQRIEANRAAKLVHRGQIVTEAAQVEGDDPETRTLGFRWSAVNNLFASSAQLGGEEWRASREVNEEDAQKERNQFVWVKPHKPEASAVAELAIDQLIVRQSDLMRGQLPIDLQAVTMGIDIGKYAIHWTLKAFSGEPTCHTIDYGVEEVHSVALGDEAAIKVCLRQIRERINQGWIHGDRIVYPKAVFVDSGHWTEAVYEFVLESGEPFWACKGFGSSQYTQPKYYRPKNCIYAGDGFHLSEVKTGSGATIQLVEIDADTWKSRVHSRLECSPDEVGAIRLFRDDPRSHFNYAKHLTAERKEEEFIAGKGLKTTWKRIRRQNHWLDTESLANVAGEAVGVTVAKQSIATEPEPQKPRVRFVETVNEREY